MRNPLELAAKSMFQVAYVVPDLHKAIQQCTRIYGAGQFLTLNDVSFEGYHYRGEPLPDVRQHVAFGFFGSTNLEVIQPLTDRSIYSDFLVQHPEGGFHHVGFKVCDFDAARAEYLKDFAEIQSGRFGAGTRFSYFDTQSALGHITELLFFDEATEEMFEGLQAGRL